MSVLSELHRERDDLEAASQQFLPSKDPCRARRRYNVNAASRVPMALARVKEANGQTWTALWVCSIRPSACTSVAPTPTCVPSRR